MSDKSRSHNTIHQNLRSASALLLSLCLICSLTPAPAEASDFDPEAIAAMGDMSGMAGFDMSSMMGGSDMAGMSGFDMSSMMGGSDMAGMSGFDMSSMMGGSDMAGFDMSSMMGGSDMAGMAGFDMSALAGMSGDSGSDSGMSVLAALYAMSDVTPVDVSELALPVNSAIYSPELALQALTFSSTASASNASKLFRDSGLEVLMQKGYEKSGADTSDTSAFTVGKATISLRNEDRTLLVISVRGTSGGEWFSNFDFSWDGTGSGTYSENFLFAAQVISLQLQPLLIKYPNPVILICGHSRGAAVANLLGMTLDDRLGQEDIYVYTFATPGTCRNEDRINAYSNIFNHINPADVVTELPLGEWGYGRIGTDITLPNDPASIANINQAMAELAAISPTVSSYYSERHSFAGPGLSDDGMTTYEVMLDLAGSLTGSRSGQNLLSLYKDFYGTEGCDDSDLAPLMLRLRKIIDTDGSFGMTVFGQHMPGTYRQLITALMSMQMSMQGMPSAPMP